MGVGTKPMVAMLIWHDFEQFTKLTWHILAGKCSTPSSTHLDSSKAETESVAVASCNRQINNSNNPS